MKCGTLTPQNPSILWHVVRLLHVRSVSFCLQDVRGVLLGWPKSLFKFFNNILPQVNFLANPINGVAEKYMTESL